MKTIFLSLLLMVTGAVAALANTTTEPQPTKGYAIRSVNFTFDVNPANPDAAQGLVCTYEIPDGTSSTDYYTTSALVSNWNPMLFNNYNAPEELHMKFNREVRLDIKVTSSEGAVESYVYNSGTFVAIRCITPIQPNSRYEIHVRAGY